MSKITLRMALDTLSKSSPFSVSTVTTRQNDALQKYKDRLYVESDIEIDFKKCLSMLNPGEVIFLCGSSGDGKSEILTRYYYTYKDKYSFHLDATHSFSPSETAIDALNSLFDQLSESNKPLVLGINIGMLANFAKEGGGRHLYIRQAIENFLETGVRTDRSYHFLDFEAYPKFSFDDQKIQAQFVKNIINRITEQTDENPFFRLAQEELNNGVNSKLHKNFMLLGRGSVQDAIVINLLKARLKKDQFVTTRALLDFIHKLLIKDDFLHNNLFTSSQSELGEKLIEYDPALIHTKQLDQFILRYELGLHEQELIDFKKSLSTIGIEVRQRGDMRGRAASLIRLFYVLQQEELGNNYHRQFANDLREDILEYYANIWALHSEFEGQNDQKIKLRDFYVKELIPAIINYANRKAPELSRRELFLGSFGGVKISTPLELKPDFQAIEKCRAERISNFNAYLKCGEALLDGISINMNLFELIIKLNKGYRPNKYDKSSIVLLDEVTEQIIRFVKSSSLLKFYDASKVFELKVDDEMINVENMD